MDRLEIAKRVEQVIEQNPVDGKPLSSYKLEKLGIISSSTLSNTLTGKVRPNRSSLSKLADFYHVSLDWLMTGNETENSNNEDIISSYVSIISNLTLSLSRRDEEIERLTKIIERLTCGSNPSCERVNKD